MAVSPRCMICIAWWCPSVMAHLCTWAQAYSVGRCHIQEHSYTGSLHNPAPSWVCYVGNVCSGHSFRASASHCKHVKKTTYILTVTPSSSEFNKRPHFPFSLRCPGNSDVMKNTAIIRKSHFLTLQKAFSCTGTQISIDIRSLTW